jgi:hypothetical protein
MKAHKIGSQTLRLYASREDATYAYVGTQDNAIVYVSTIDNTIASRAYPEESIGRDLAAVASGKTDITKWMGDSDRKHLGTNYDVTIDAAKFSNENRWTLIAVADRDGVVATVEGTPCPSQEYIVSIAKKLLAA